jgi:hypothetical protein
MKNPLIVSSPGGEMKTGYICPQVKINIMRVEFLANLAVLKSWGIDIILGMDWLQKHDGVIQCGKKSVLLTGPQGERIEYVGTPSSNSGTMNSVEGKALEDIREVSEFPDVFPEDLPTMPPDRDIEFSIELIPEGSKRRTREGGGSEWEPIKILSQKNSAYIPIATPSHTQTSGSTHKPLLIP